MFVKDDKMTTDSDMVGYIGKGMMVEGRLSFDSTVRIDGSFKGEISAKGTLVVGESGMVEANVKVESVIVTGEIKGVVEASKRIELQVPGRIIGEVKTPNLIIGDGAILDGSCIMLKKESNQSTGTVEYWEGKAKEGEG